MPSIELGPIYRSAAVLGEAGRRRRRPARRPAPSERPAGYAHPARLALRRNGTSVSTLDLAGTGFALLAGSGGQAWIEAAKALSATDGPPLNAHRLAPDGDLADPEGRFEQNVGIDPEGALLLRPDGVIAWRALGSHADPRATLDAVMRRLTFREIAAASPGPRTLTMAEQQRCAWSGNDPLMIAYHDEEWGVPVHDDRLLFEFLILEGAQAGLALAHHSRQARELSPRLPRLRSGEDRALRRR